MFGKFPKVYVCPLKAIASRSASLVILFLLSISCAMAQDGEKVYRTGLEASNGRFTVAPNGQQLVFETNRLAHGLRLLDLGSGKITVLPEEKGRTFGSPDWSPDGKWIAVVSATVKEGYYQLEAMEIVLLEVGSWQRRRIAVDESFKSSPFFSADGKTVYYFKGKIRTSGKTPASRYDLYAIDLASGMEARLTHEEFYQAAKGDETNAAVLFSATPNFDKRFKDAQGKESRSALFSLDKTTGRLSHLPIDQRSGIFNFSNPLRDRAGNINFIAAKASPSGGNYLWFLVRVNVDGTQMEMLTELPISMRFDIAGNTGEIYVMDKEGKELIFRRLAVLAAH